MPIRARTLVALLFHVLLLHVSVLGGGMACASARADVAGPGTAAPVGAEHAAHDAHAGHAPSSEDAPGDAPADDAGRPSPHHDDLSHCATATGCAAVAVVGPVVSPAALAAVGTRAASARVSLPPSTRAAPEPPPPRA